MCTHRQTHTEVSLSLWGRVKRWMACDALEGAPRLGFREGHKDYTDIEARKHFLVDTKLIQTQRRENTI